MELSLMLAVAGLMIAARIGVPVVTTALAKRRTMRERAYAAKRAAEFVAKRAARARVDQDHAST
jgi:hypothetical protein